MTSWNCTHCKRVFYGPVCLQFGKRLCYYHPGKPTIVELGFFKQFSCCGAPQHSAKYERGCTPIEHLPLELFDLLSPDGDLIVPTFILSPQHHSTIHLGNTSLLTEWQQKGKGSPLKQYLSTLIRSDTHYWTTLPSRLFQEIKVRAEQRRLVHASTTSDAQVLTWAPYQPLPEAPPIVAAALANNKKTVTQKREEEEERQKMLRTAHFLCMSYHEELTVKPPIVGTATDNSLEAMIAEELKSVPIEWTVLRCI
jgi:hypothetical protein